MEENIISIKGLSKSFGNTKVLNDLNIDIHKGEFVTLLGPSGCGKTTTLRLIAGLETPDCGAIYLKGEDITGLPSEKRKVNTVFQNYALFPHMNVFNNVAYGLKIKNTPKNVIREKVAHMLEQVRMTGFETRMPERLSGGQRQRVAIARALVNEPDVLLLDEPLGALDLKLRQHMQSELKSIQENLGITFVYVTHDQDEALNMSDRLVVMEEGRICQIGPPREIYDYPKNRFVAGFVGERNMIEGQLVRQEGGRYFIRYAGVEVEAHKHWADIPIPGDGQVTATIHADKVALFQEPPDGFFIEGKVLRCTFTGALTKIELELATGEVLKKNLYNGGEDYEKGQLLYLNWEPKDCLVIEGGR